MAPNRYFHGTGKRQLEFNRLYARLVPPSGKADSEAGELLRSAWAIYRDCYNNGGCNLPNYLSEIELLAGCDDIQKWLPRLTVWLYKHANKIARGKDGGKYLPTGLLERMMSRAIGFAMKQAGQPITLAIAPTIDTLPAEEPMPNDQIKLRLTPEDRRILAAVVKSTGCDSSAAIRAAIRRLAKKPPTAAEIETAKLPVGLAGAASGVASRVSGERKSLRK